MMEMQQRVPFRLPITHRLRRNRKSTAIRSLLSETVLTPADFVVPLFILEGRKIQEAIPSMPGIFRFSLDLIIHEVKELFRLGIPAIDLFPVIPKQKKDACGSEALRKDNLLEVSIKAIKDAVPEMCIMVDLALDPYTDHGHDGLVDVYGNIMNDETVEVLGRMAISATEAGADVIAPSDMMDGRIGYLRNVLDEAGYINVSILSYAAKYASALYGPFRDALNSAPKFGDKKTYQMDPANSREALLECAMDEAEGADMLLIKPGLAYLDIISKVRDRTDLPLGAYHVSGEYSMVMAAAERGWIDGEKVMKECLLSIKRAGADFILSYAAKMIFS